MFVHTHVFSPHALIRAFPAQAASNGESTYANVANPPHVRPADAGWPPRT